MTSPSPSPELVGEVLAILGKIAPDLEPAALDRGRPLTDQADLDSLDRQTFLAALGKRYHVEISEADEARLLTLDQIVAYLAERAAR